MIIIMIVKIMIITIMIIMIMIIIIVSSCIFELRKKESGCIFLLCL